MMILRRRTALAAIAVLAAAAVPAGAGELAIEAHAGYLDMTAGNSTSALFGSTGAGTFGGAVRYTFWRGAFLSAGARTLSKDGERVFVASPNSPVQKLGFPLSIRLTPIVLQAGYRIRDGHLVVPYVAAGLSVMRFREESEVAGEAFDEERTKTGFLGAAGAEVGRGHVRFGAEVGWSTVPDAIGMGGVSKVYGEDDLGGLHAVGKLVFAF
jgi:opacity protein-like surface antigen